MKTLRYLLLTLALLVPVGLLAQAGDQGGPTGAGPHMPSVDDELEHLSSRLTLTDAQKPQVRAVLQDERDQMSKAMDSSASRPDTRAKMRQIHEASATKIRALLSDEQKITFDKIQAEHRNRMKHGGEGAPAPPPSQE